MIELDFSEIFTDDFVTKYTTSMLGKIAPFNIYSNGVKISVSEEDLRFLLFNPFFSGECKSDFISDYYKIVNFLLHSPRYFEYLKTHWREEGLSKKEQKSRLYNERGKIVGEINLSVLNKYPPINLGDFLVTEKNYLAFYKNIDLFFGCLNEKIRSHINYDFIDSDMRSYIIKTINIKICPYCNRQYVGYYNFDKKQKNIASLDHFYPKTKFPLYSMSLLNLIPSCFHCNGMVKKDRLYPMKHIYREEVEERIYFSLRCLSPEGVLDESGNFELLTSDHDHHRLTSHFFRHKELYSTHSDDICLWLKKKKLHNEGYRSHLSSMLNRNITEDELKMLLFETTGSASDVINKPLGKLKKDILKL